MPPSPEQQLITREEFASHRRKADLHRSRSARTDDSAEVQRLDQAIDALAEKLGCRLAAFTRAQGRLIRLAPQISVKRTARDEAESIFNPVRRREG